MRSAGLTLAAVADDPLGANDVVTPGVAALLDSKQVIFLLVVEYILRSNVARHILLRRGNHVPVLESVMLCAELEISLFVLCRSGE